MDVRMPRMDGPEALARIRAGETGGRDIPVIALTAEAADAPIQLRAGFDGVQPKPVDAAGLVGAVTAACRRPRGERHAAAA
jgi:CheY-like chemotaxis protein